MRDRSVTRELALELHLPRLVDGADDGAPARRDALHRAHDEERRAGVEARGGFVEEEHGGVGHELDADGQALPLAHQQARFCVLPDDAVCRLW
jgi:hypothetical protein